MLFLYDLLLKLFPEYIIFIALDVSTACVLYHVAKKEVEEVYKEREVNKDQAGGDVIRKFWRGREFADAPFYVVLVYLFNPFGVASCVGMSTVTLNNFFVVLFLYCLVEGKFVPNTLCVNNKSGHFRQCFSHIMACTSECCFFLSVSTFCSYGFKVCKVKGCCKWYNHWHCLTIGWF